MPEESMEALVEKFRSAQRTRPDYPRRLLELAAVVAQKQGMMAAYHLCREAIAESKGDPEIEIRAQRLASALVAPYHVRMMNDPVRTAAWHRALTRAVRPGSHVLEIGTGGGLLAMMAARAGARVTTCERDPVLAALAREIVALNGYADRVVVIAKRSEDLVVGADLERPAELLFGDIFGTDLLNFEPLAAIADARRRLLLPEAGAVPSAATISLALAHWRGYRGIAQIDRVDGFDFTPFQRVLPSDITLGIDDPELALRSAAAIAFRFDFGALIAAPEAERARIPLEASSDGVVNGIVQWINLQLDGDTALETRPGEGTPYFMGCRFYPLRAPLDLRKGDTLNVGAAHDGRRPIVWLDGRAKGRRKGGGCE